jgi:hypothetical protein
LSAEEPNRVYAPLVMRAYNPQQDSVALPSPVRIEGSGREEEDEWE